MLVTELILVWLCPLACENCFELDAELFGLVIFVDVIGTAIVMMIIFKFTKKKSSDEPAHFSKRKNGM